MKNQINICWVSDYLAYFPNGKSTFPMGGIYRDCLDWFWCSLSKSKIITTVWWWKPWLNMISTDYYYSIMILNHYNGDSLEKCVPSTFHRMGHPIFCYSPDVKWILNCIYVMSDDGNQLYPHTFATCRSMASSKSCLLCWKDDNRWTDQPTEEEHLQPWFVSSPRLTT